MDENTSYPRSVTDPAAPLPDADQAPESGADRVEGTAAAEPPAHQRANLAGWLLELVRLGAVGYLTTLLMLTVWTLLPLLAGWQVAVITTGSMMPMIQPGDVVVFDKPDLATLKRGQVILFTDPAKPSRQLTHRIKEIKSDGTFVTQGDANRDADLAPVPPGNVHGRGRLVVPYVGRMALWNTPSATSAYTWLTSVVLALITLQVIATLNRRRAQADGAGTEPDPDPSTGAAPESDDPGAGRSPAAGTATPQPPPAPDGSHRRHTNRPKARL